MALHLYRRHRLKCEATHPEDSCSSEHDERRRGWKRCTCGIHVSGTLGGKFSRRATSTGLWDDARAYVAALESVGSWDGKAVPPPPVEVPVPAPDPPAATAESHSAKARMALAEACQLFRDHRASAGLEAATLRKYATFTKQISVYAASRGYVMVDQFTPTDIDRFWVTWNLGPRTKGKRLTMLRGFFRFCVHRKWIAESPVSPDIRPPKGANKDANKAPFTDEELARIIRACDRVAIEWKNETGTGVWTGEDLQDVIWLMVYTGYRISDATLFDSRRLQGNQVFVRAKKNGGDVFTYVPDWLRDRLLARVARCGRRPLITGRSDRLETVTNIWRRRIARAFALAGPFEEPPTPHRFRHTFARILLQKGVSCGDVAELLGDDEETVRKHYARWVPERQARLTTILQEAFSDKPRFTVLQGGRG